jgi:hypothetical protein
VIENVGGGWNREPFPHALKCGIENFEGILVMDGEQPAGPNNNKKEGVIHLSLCPIRFGKRNCLPT